MGKKHRLSGASGFEEGFVKCLRKIPLSRLCCTEVAVQYSLIARRTLTKHFMKPSLLPVTPNCMSLND